MFKIGVSCVLALAILASTSTVFAGRYYSSHSYYSHGWRAPYHHRGPYYSYYRSGGRYHHSDSDDLLAGLLLGGLFVGALAVATQPRPVQYVAAEPVYMQPQVVVQPPRVCVEERVVGGEYQYNPGTGSTIWVPYVYPMTRQFQVPCY